MLSASELVELIAHIDAQVKGGAEGDEMNDDDGDLDVEPVIIVESILSRLLRPRLAHRLPLSLYTGPEREALSAIKENAGELANGAEQPLTMLDAAGNRIPIPADAPAIYREMAEQERQAAIMTPEARKLLALRGKLHVRFALDGRPDVKERHARKSPSGSPTMALTPDGRSCPGSWLSVLGAASRRMWMMSIGPGPVGRRRSSSPIAWSLPRLRGAMPGRTGKALASVDVVGAPRGR